MTEGPTSGSFRSGGSADIPDPLLPLIREATQGEYEIERELGRGGMAAVYLARDIALNRSVAIKTMLPELIARPAMVQRFKREAQLAAGLSHPHIIQIHSVRETARLVYFVMKFVKGRSIDSVLGERRALDLDTTRLVMQQAGSALSFAHHHGVIHRDVKPANIMIDENGWAIVTDFGIAKIEDAQQLTATGTAIGTPHYMSPEQFHNKPVTGASDQYALAIVAYEMLTGKKPFDGDTVAEIITKHLFNPPPDVREDRPELPSSVAETLTRMLAKEPTDRFPDLDAAIAAFGAPSPEHLDAVRSQLMSLGRAGVEQQPLRLSVPVSPVPGTRPGAPPTVVAPATGAQPGPQRPAPAAQGVAARSGRGRAALLSLGVALLLVIPGYFAGSRWLQASRSPDRNPALARGVQLLQQGQAEAARTQFGRAAAEMPNSALPLVYLSRMSRDGGDLPRARAEAVRALQAEPNNPVALREMGAVLLASGNLEPARRFFARALRADPGDRASMGWLGCTLQRLGQTEQATRWLRRAGEGPWGACGA